MSEKTRAELKEQIKIMNHNYQVIREMHEKGYQYSIGEIKRLQDELERTRKALEIAKDTFNWIDETYQTGQEMEAEIWGKVQLAAQEITALEQKDK